MSFSFGSGAGPWSFARWNACLIKFFGNCSRVTNVRVHLNEFPRSEDRRRKLRFF